MLCKAAKGVVEEGEEHVHFHTNIISTVKSDNILNKLL